MATVDSDDKDLKLTIETSYDGTGWDAMIVKPELSYSPVEVNLPSAAEAVYALLTDEGVKAAIAHEVAKKFPAGRE